MKKIITLLVISCLFSKLTCANDALNEHAFYVSKAMSAFYMYGLSQYDEKYQQQYQRYINQAQQHFLAIPQTDAKLAAQLREQWDAIRPYIKYESDGDNGYYVPGVVQGQFRNYLALLYTKTRNISHDSMSVPEKIAILNYNIEVLSARYFDVVSSISTNTARAFLEDETFSEKRVAKEIDKTIASLYSHAGDKALNKNMRDIEVKWKFIENSVVDHSNKSAVLTVYYNINKISSLLKKSDVMLSENQR